MINILGNSGRILEMKQVIDQMKEDSCECKDSVFVGAIRTFASAGMVNEALNLFYIIPQFNCVNFTESFNTILGIVLKESNFKAAYQLFSDNCWKLEVKSRVRSLNLLMEGLCRFKNSDLALNIFQEMDFQGCYPDRESYRILMKGLCDDGRSFRNSWEGFEEGLKAPKSCRLRLDLSQCRDREDSELAIGYLKKMSKQVGNMSCDVVRRYGKSGNAAGPFNMELIGCICVL
ncbi:hypothetical protein F3Y22_tig00008218pilonHSYRG00001 [Hibiscus syriacus]|uniref:Pentatricopeptide repeat-containing protein n=1 Tax=Hibiscus syriacus TaxID=106335 RepID=A0A6A3C8Y2_HIBSY|nr:hypothetical protein F3Y22_tig00008218pilonHSYRG00001 [Hibiscus syriacus]